MLKTIMTAMLIISLVTAVSLLSACGGGDAKVSYHPWYGANVGRELIDLRAARDANIITEDEYIRYRAQILNRRYNN